MIKMLQASWVFVSSRIKAVFLQDADEKRAARNLFLWFCLAVAVALPSNAEDSITLVGAGSTVPLPLYAKWAQEYNKVSHGSIMQYQALGTNEGLKLISGDRDELGKSDFAAGEVLLTDAERSKGNLIELPAVMIAIVPIYNVPGLAHELRFSGDLLSKIYLGHIKLWNAPQIAALNPGINLPAMP